MAEEQVEVTFTVKELFQQIQSDTKDIKASLALKADASRVNGIDKCLRDMLADGSPTSQKNVREIEKLNTKMATEVEKVNTKLDAEVEKVNTKVNGLALKVASISGGVVVLVELARMALTYLHR